MKITLDTDYLKELNVAGVIILGYLSEHPDNTVSDMARDLHRTECNILEQLRQLEDAGYIKRKWGKNTLGRLSFNKPRIIGAEVLK